MTTDKIIFLIEIRNSTSKEMVQNFEDVLSFMLRHQAKHISKVKEYDPIKERFIMSSTFRFINVLSGWSEEKNEELKKYF